MPEAQTISLKVVHVVQAAGGIAFFLLMGWAFLRARGLLKRKPTDAHVAFFSRFCGALLVLAFTVAAPKVVRFERDFKFQAANAARSAAVLAAGVVAILIAGTRRDAIILEGQAERIRELEADLGRLVASVAEYRQAAESISDRAAASSTVDSATGLASRKLFDDVIGRELKRAKRHERPLSLILAEVDYLEKYTSSFGHQATEQLVLAIANLVKGQVRDTDLLVRFSHSRFAILMPETDLEKASEIADWLRSMVSNSPFPNRSDMPGQKISVSLGVGAFPQPLIDPATFLALVEAALERASTEKNRMKVAQ